MGNTTSIRNLTPPAVADLLSKENAAFQPFAEKLFTGDGYLSLVDGNYLLSLNLDKPSDAEAFESILDTMNVSLPAFVRKSLENLLRETQQRSSEHQNTTPLQEESPQPIQLSLTTTTETSKVPPSASISSTASLVAPRRYAEVAATPAAVTTASSKVTPPAPSEAISSTFRQDIGGKRVFVQSLPPYASSHDVKNHFQFAGHVVLATVSKDDPVTGASKRCGVVQYETVEMAQRAIAAMQHHSMDGYNLYVRQDKKDLDNEVPQQPDANSVLTLCKCCAKGIEEETGSWLDGAKLAPQFKRALNSPMHGEASRSHYKRTRAHAQTEGFIDIGRRNYKTGLVEVVSKKTFVPDLSPEIYIRLTPKGQQAVQRDSTSTCEKKKHLNTRGNEPSLVASSNARLPTNSIHDRLTAAPRRPFAEVATPSVADTAARNDEVQLFLAIGGVCKTILLGTVTLVNNSCPQTRQLWTDLTRIVLEDYTKAAWARHVVTNVTIEASDNQGKNEIAGFLREMGINRKSAYGRFLISSVMGDGSSKAVTGAMVVSYVQCMKNEKGRLECRVEKDIRRIKDCPLEPLSSPEPEPLLAAVPTSRWAALTPLPLKTAPSVLSVTTSATTEGEKGTQMLSSKDGFTPTTNRLTGSNGTGMPSSTESSTPNTGRLTESNDTWIPSSTEGLTPAGDSVSAKSKKEEEAALSEGGFASAAEHAATSTVSGDLSRVHAEAMSLLDNNDDDDGEEISDLDRLIQHAEREMEGMMLSGGEDDVAGSAVATDDDDVRLAIKELEAIMLSLGHSDSGDSKEESNVDDDVEQAVEDLEAMLASVGETDVPNDSPTCYDEQSEKWSAPTMQRLAESKGPRALSSTVLSTPTKRPTSSLQAAIAKGKHVVQTASSNTPNSSQSDRPTLSNGTRTPSSTLSAAAPLYQPRRTGSPASASAKSAPHSSPSAQISDTKSSVEGALSSPTTVMLAPAAFPPARCLSDKKVASKRLWWADACLEDGDGALLTAFPSARPSDDKKVDAAPVASFPARYLKDTKKLDVDDSVMVKFHQSLDGKLKKAFAARSSPVDDRRQNYLEVSDMWNEQMKEEGSEKGFVELSDRSKDTLVSIVYRALHDYNQANDKDLVVRKSSQNMKLLTTLTIFENEDAAKRKAAEFRKTKLCRYWPKGMCTRGDACTYAHGVHELVG